ncbi:hypothetical protein niasHT_033973 [Heterodera trifolii]|uniref:F-box domain-containing protein n=1 Tax=Heterodera trifolii TaxID=157864 RepID=A0ABD2IHW0_9BILA
MNSSIYIPNDVLFDVFKLCDRFTINERLEFVNAHWSAFIAANETNHFPKFKMGKLWICPLFCSLQYSLMAHEETTNGEIFANCTDKCLSFYSQFVSDEWPAQRIPFCIYIQRFANDATTLKKVTLNNCDLCFGKMTIDIFNDRALTLFLIDCPIFKPHAEHFKIRTSTEPWAFKRVVELIKKKITLKIDKNYLNEMRQNGHQFGKLCEIDNSVIEFILTGRQFCSKIVVEAHQFALLFELIEKYKSASIFLHHAIPIVRLFVPSFAWHRRQFVEGTLCQMFRSSQNLSPLAHKFAYFDGFSAQEKFTCVVRFTENEEDKIEFFAPFLSVLFLFGSNELNLLLVDSSKNIEPPKAGESCGCADEQPGTLLLVCIIKCRDELVKMSKKRTTVDQSEDG